MFRYIHNVLVEAGLINMWKSRVKDDVWFQMVGFRPKEDISEKTDLNFDDLQPAWMALVVGLCISAIGFAGEIVKKRLDYRRSHDLEATKN